MEQEPVTDRALIRCVVMFLLTLCSVYLVYGYQWSGGDPLSDSKSAMESLIFSSCLMFILLSHELGHYIVARKHGFALSLPYFLPFPYAFGTLGAVIRLKSMPKSRNALLEMGAAGPIAGFIAAILCALWGMPYTNNKQSIEIPNSLKEPLSEMMVIEPTKTEASIWMTVLDTPTELLYDGLVWLGLVPKMAPGEIPITILADPLLLKASGNLMLGEQLSPYAELHPAAFACWVGCLLTAINLIPVGQLDGGHICHALFPKHAKAIGKGAMIVVLMGSVLWLGWLVWAVMLNMMGATKGLKVPNTVLSDRAKMVSCLALLAFVFSFMIRPVQLINIQLSEITWIEESK